MEIFTLLKANVRHKKGAFVSVVLLTLIITVSVTTILSIRESVVQGVNHAQEICDIPDVSVFYLSNRQINDLADEIRSDDRVQRVEMVEYIACQKSLMGKEEYNNSIVLVKADEDTRILREDLRGIAEDAPRLQKGEIYVSQGFLTSMNGKVGEKVVFRTLSGEYEFTVKGVLLEPVFGASTIGWKVHCISEEDFSEIAAAVLQAETEDQHGLGKLLNIYKADGCALTSGQFRQQLNLDTGVTDMANGSTTKDMSYKFTTLFPETISSILMVFVLFLMAIVVIVMVHSTSVEIETNYVTLGVLKAQGFDKNKIRLLFLGQYMLAEILGAALGICVSIPLIGAVSNVFVTITAIPAVTRVPVGLVALLVASLFAVSFVSIFFVTIKADRISPVRAISGAKREIYFDSRLNVPISRKLLSPSLALRQFTSAKRRYAGTMAITAVLVFFMMTITLIADTVDSKAALESMGAMVDEIQAVQKTALSDEEFENIKAEIERFTKIKRADQFGGSYFSFDGEEMCGIVYSDPSVLPVLKGRSPLYDNEIAVSPVLMDEFNLKIGDEVTVGRRGAKKKFLISGTVQLINDAGMAFLISQEGARRIGFDVPLQLGFSLEDGSNEKQNQEIAELLNKKFGDKIEAGAYSRLLGETETAAVVAMQALIYVCSILFSVIVVHMVCSKMFTQERVDIGIYKAVGFQTSGLRRQFAFRFLSVSVLGAAAGGTLSCLFSGKMLSVLLKGMGITSFSAKIGFSSFAMPTAVICSSFFVFSYLVSGKIKKVKIRELVTE